MHIRLRGDKGCKTSTNDNDINEKPRDGDKFDSKSGETCIIITYKV